MLHRPVVLVAGKTSALTGTTHLSPSASPRRSVHSAHSADYFSARTTSNSRQTAITTLVRSARPAWSHSTTGLRPLPWFLKRLASAAIEAQFESLQLLVGLSKSAKSDPETTYIERKLAMKSVGSCSACGRQISAIPMSEVMQLMMSGGEAAIKGKATRCPKCAKLYCTGCVHAAGQKCPSCKVGVEEVH